MTAFVCWTTAKLLNLASQRISMHWTVFFAGCVSARASRWKTSAEPERSSELAMKLIFEEIDELTVIGTRFTFLML